MSKYTTGELAKLCSVTVRTVQYYDSRGILAPTELSEGGRRLYSDSDLRRLKLICFLRDLGLPINAISQILAEEKPESVLSLLIEQQEKELKSEIEEHRQKLEKLAQLRRELRDADNFSLDSIGDIAYRMENKKQLRKMRLTMLAVCIPLSALQWFSIIFWILTGTWWPFLLWVVIFIPVGIWVSRYYFRRVEYICPMCHKVFRPGFKEAFFANHTPKTRKLTCPACKHKGFCVEVYGGVENES